ncbi:NAD(P)-binding protein, partial [Nocardioides sp.]|uniref:NAD(P)-binding protein n=1 Tax=Nocardioides sp. TaxID=35761 RepID=UPI00356969B9
MGLNLGVCRRTRRSTACFDPSRPAADARFARCARPARAPSVDHTPSPGGTMQERTIETVVIGAGQAGLATGYHLRRKGREFVILDSASRVG